MGRARSLFVCHQCHAAGLAAEVVGILARALGHETGAVELPKLAVVLVNFEAQLVAVVLPVPLAALFDLDLIGKLTAVLEALAADAPLQSVVHISPLSLVLANQPIPKRLLRLTVPVSRDPVFAGFPEMGSDGVRRFGRFNDRSIMSTGTNVLHNPRQLISVDIVEVSVDVDVSWRSLRLSEQTGVMLQ